MKTRLIERPLTHDRQQLSMNDVWGLGFLQGVTGGKYLTEDKEVWCYCKKSVARDQYYDGLRYGRYLQATNKPFP